MDTGQFGSIFRIRIAAVCTFHAMNNIEPNQTLLNHVRK